ncbi:hypothetical protein [Nostoc sp.]|uniref:hypothetical protein n=1 Tax=Nostoc sp. TaxID=1180 RepID=UPI002FFCEE8C
MARKVRAKEWAIGLYVHYWGKTYRVWSLYESDALLVIPGYRPCGWYCPHGSENKEPTSVTVRKDDDFVLILDNIKKDVFGREIK